MQKLWQRPSRLRQAQRIFAAEEWVQAQDWTGKEEPCAVQVALKQLRSCEAK